MERWLGWTWCVGCSTIGLGDELYCAGCYEDLEKEAVRRQVEIQIEKLDSMRSFVINWDGNRKGRRKLTFTPVEETPDP